MNISELITLIKASNAKGLRLKLSASMIDCVKAYPEHVHIERDYTDYVHLGAGRKPGFVRIANGANDYPDYEGMILDRQERAMMDY